MPPTRLDPPTHKHKHKQGAVLVPADYGTGASGMVESPHANIFMSMFYIVSDTTTSELRLFVDVGGPSMDHVI